MKHNEFVDYYTEFYDSNGAKHYAVHRYNRNNGFVSSVRDHKFTDLNYTVKSKKDCKNMEIPEKKTIETNLGYGALGAVYKPHTLFVVRDKDGRVIAKLNTMQEASVYSPGLGFTVKEEEVQIESRK